MNRSRILRLALLQVFLSVVCIAQTAQSPDVILEGKIVGSQNQTYLEIPFQVPEGVHRLSVDFHYSNHEEHTTLDLGVADPQRFRGASGGNKDHFTLSETDATPSYLPGPIPAGSWKLLVSVPNIRAEVVATYHADVRFNSVVEDHSFALAPLADGLHWYRGDLHMHTAHSDGSCGSQSGKRVPCPLFFTVQSAASQGLDFIAITDHNTDSQNEAMRELQPYFDKVLLIPGREMTTFYGHLNVFGVTRFIDYRVQPQGIRDTDAIVRDALAQGGIASVNHAAAPSGEACMGCGWTPSKPADMSRFAAVEVINGGSGRMFSSAEFWERQLRDGHRLTAIGGSDNHNGPLSPDHPGAVGWPTTVVRAKELSVPAILDGIRAGHVFIDLTASRNRLLEMEARAAGSSAEMGDVLAVSAGAKIDFRFHVTNCAQSTLHLLLDGKEAADAAPLAIRDNDAQLETRWTSVQGRHWLRAEVRDGNGTLMLLGNPVYINFPAQ
jgi:predicted metal-dependent phosphoesterase TrpH